MDQSSPVLPEAGLGAASFRRFPCVGSTAGFPGNTCGATTVGPTVTRELSGTTSGRGRSAMTTRFLLPGSELTGFSFDRQS